jgi:hypothetical protein
METAQVGRGRNIELQPGTYSDGHPLDEVQYLECKLILKPDRFTAAKVFFDLRVVRAIVRFCASQGCFADLRNDGWPPGGRDLLLCGRRAAPCTVDRHI